MRKILFIVLLVLMVLIFGFTVVKGIDVAKITIFGYPQIKDRNGDIKEKNDKLTNLVESEYPKAVAAVGESEKQLKATKEEYESQIALGSSGSGYTAAIEKYEIEYLWTRIGNHAKDNDVDMKIELTTSSMGAGFYKMNFTCSGTYVGITDFIYAIENDSKLGFKIDNFVMTNNSSGDGIGELKATFSCDEIGINIQSIETQATNAENKSNDTTTNTTKNNTTNNTASNTTNTTSSTTKANGTTSTANATKAASTAIDEAVGE